MARISNCFLLFACSVVLGVALAATQVGQHFEKESTVSSHDAVDGYAWRSSNLGNKEEAPCEITTRGFFDAVWSFIREILQNIIIALDLKAPANKPKLEQYRRLLENIKNRLLQMLEE